MSVTTNRPILRRCKLPFFALVGMIALVAVVPGCTPAEQSGDEGDESEVGSRRSDEVEQIAAAVETALDEADMGAWRIVEPVTFRFGASAETRLPRVATIAFTCMFSIKIEDEEHENLVRNNGRLVYHQDQWKLQQVSVAFKFFDKAEFTDESDLLATPLIDGETLTVLKELWEVTVRDTVAVQLAERQYEKEAAEEAAAEAKARKEAEEEAEQVAKQAKVDALTTRLDEEIRENRTFNGALVASFNEMAGEVTK